MRIACTNLFDMLLNNILEKDLALFCQPNLEIQKLWQRPYSCSFSLSTVIVYSLKVSNVAYISETRLQKCIGLYTIRKFFMQD